MSETNKQIFFLGIGGIGMSALARYYKHEGYTVAGYDRTPSDLTRALESEGIEIVYGDDQLEIGDWRLKLSTEDTLVVRTPAVPENNSIYTYLREQGFTILKRAEALGKITATKKALCVAGTHGKTTTSTILAHLMALHGKNEHGLTRKGTENNCSQINQIKQIGNGVNAFLGGISENYKTNLLLDKESEYVVVEAD